MEGTVLEGQFWAKVRYVLLLTKHIHSLIWFSDINQLVIRELYEQIGNMLGQIKDNVEPRDAILYDHIHKHVVKRWDNLNVPLHVLAYVHTPKYYSLSWLAQLEPGGGFRRKSHISRCAQ